MDRNYRRQFQNSIPTTNPVNSTVIEQIFGIVDPVMPTTKTTQMREGDAILSAFDTVNNLNQRDQQCRMLQTPVGMRTPATTTGCGWWYTYDTASPSVAAYGTEDGPLNLNLGNEYGPGEWIWNPTKASQQENIKQTKKVKSCHDIDYYKQYTNMGWCSSLNSAVINDGKSECPEPLIMSSADCPPTAPTGGISELCNPNGALSPACLQSLTSTICSPNGSLAKAYSNGYPSSSQSFMDTNAYLSQRGFTLNSSLITDGQLSTAMALQSITGLSQYANSGTTDSSTAAAMNMCYGTQIDLCNIPESRGPPYDINCVKRAAIQMGYSPSGKLLQNDKTYWNGFSTWGALLTNLRNWKNIADNGPVPNDQAIAINNVYSISVQFPKSLSCSPSAFSGLILWLDAADKSSIVMNGSSVARWKNKSGNGSAAIANAGVEWSATGSSNRTPAVLFKNRHWLNGDITMNGNSSTTFCVFNMSGMSKSYARIVSLGTKNAGPHYINSDYNNNGHFGILRAGGNNLMQDRNNVWSVNQIDLDRVQLSTSWIDGATSNIAINGNAPVTVGSGGAFTINGYTVGNNIATDDPNSPLYGSISEIVVFNIALSKGQRQQIEGYLAWKWEIQAQLPSSHPYKNSAPGKTLPPVTVTGQINIGDVGMPPGHIYPEPYGLIVSTSVGGSSFNTIRNGIKAGTSYEITVTSNTGAKVTTPLTAINTDGGFYTTMNTPINMKTTFPIPPTRSLAISISPISTNSPTIMFGPWIGKDTPIQSVSTLMSGETVYMIETELHTKMVTESGVAKYYNGKMSDFNANNWNTYYDAAGNYKIR